MADFREQFLVESAGKLRDLSKNLQKHKTLSDEDRTGIFRVIHTIKGTSQTFGLTAAGDLADKLEDLLAAADPERANPLLPEGIELLIRTLEKKDTVLPEGFLDRIGKFAPACGEPKISDKIPAGIPAEMFSRLSSQEKSALSAELGKGRHLFGLQLICDLANFAAELRTFREKLSRTGEIIAIFPAAEAVAPGRIGFQLLLASAAPTAKIGRIARAHGADVFLDTSPDAFTDDLNGVLRRIAAHAESIAGRSNKNIRFRIESDETSLAADKLRLVFEILLHLVRNAVDHAIAAEGEIGISARSEEDGLHLTVSDDGGGIDRRKIKNKAVEKNLISAGDKLSDQATLELIFRSEFSTASRVTETSGRGVGLDAVKDAVERAGGRISLKSETGRGTVFEVFLPKKQGE